MNYQIHITSMAERDIMRAMDYIEFNLKNPDAADNLVDAVTEKVASLSYLPQKFRWGVRFIVINNYIAFYTIDEAKKMVYVVRFLYQKSNWISILLHGFSI